MVEREHHLCQTRDDYRKLFGEIFGIREGGEFIPAAPRSKPVPTRPECVYRSSLPIVKRTCNCPRKWVYGCSHPDRAEKTCKQSDCQKCGLYDEA